MTGTSSPCQADLAVAFSFPPETGSAPEPPLAVAAGPAAYRELVRELKTLPDSSGIAWHQQLFSDGGPSTPVLGTAEQSYDDGSELSVMIRTDPPPGSPRQFEIATSIIVTRPGDPSDQRAVHYDLEPGAAAVTRKIDNAYGNLLAGITAIAQRLTAADLDTETLETHLDAALAEAGLAEKGLDPALDPAVEKLRAADSVYRRESDTMREAAAARKLADASGVPREQPAGTAEIRALRKLLRSL